MVNIYAFDVDDTLNAAGGPVSIEALQHLREAGHVVGLCGNWSRVTSKNRLWHQVLSFLGPVGTPKEEFLTEIKMHCPADDYILVGNDPQFYGQSDDKAAAQAAGWRFIRETDFAAGQR